MNVFEDLIEELKDEDLLEQTVINNSETNESKDFGNNQAKVLLDVENADTLLAEEILETERFLQQLEEDHQNDEIESEIVEPTQENLLEIGFPTQIQLDSINPHSTNNEPQNPKPKQKLSEFEFFRKRAMEEVASLQMVDNIFTSVEREQMKIIPKPFDDLTVKKVLHSFLQVPGDVGVNKHAEAEFELRQGTESWYSSLSERDREISVENLRYCCETTRPPLSPPALLALAKFYRNAPFSEAGRNKFDLIITRLFSRDIEHNKRELVFSHRELSEHLSELYAEWESIAFYPTEENDEEILLTVLKFEDFISEANRADSFDDLIKTEFFNRVRALKRSAGETFYAPQVAAMSIFCNVKIGNRYVDLLDIEKEKTFEEAIEEKYGFIFDQSISDSTNKSLQLSELLKKQKEKAKIFDIKQIERQQKEKQKSKNANGVQNISENIVLQKILSINKVILAAAVLTIILTVGLYFWVEVIATQPESSDKAQQVYLENTEFKEFIQSAKVNNETLFVIGTSAWETLTIDKKKEMLSKLLADGKTKNYKKVHLANQKGLIIGSANQDNIELK